MGTLSYDTVRQLAALEPGGEVLSVYARTDPSDPANTNHAPAWEIALRNGLSQVEQDLNGNGARDQRQSYRELRERAERALQTMPPAQRARSVVLFYGADGEELGRFSLQLPVTRDRVVWDSRPFVSPLIDVAQRGRPTGVILVGADHVRLLETEFGHITEPEHSTYNLELGDWRSYAAYAHANPQRGQQTNSHLERYEARVSEHRAKFFDSTAAAVSRRFDELGWGRAVIVADGQSTRGFRSALPGALAEKVIGEIDTNAAHEEPAKVGAMIEPHLDRIETEARCRLAEGICAAAAAGGEGAAGAQEVLGTLGQGRVSELVIDPEFDFSPYAAAAPDTVGGPPEMLAERAVEVALGTGAEVITLDSERCAAFRESGSMVARLRY